MRLAPVCAVTILLAVTTLTTTCSVAYSDVTINIRFRGEGREGGERRKWEMKLEELRR